MIIQDNVIKEALKNVYFVSGTACGGKSTISCELGKKYDILVYDIDREFEKHRTISCVENQPYMNQSFSDADEFFGRNFEEYRRWLVNGTREQLDFVIMDLVRLARDRKVICDCHILVEQARRLTDSSHIVFLLRDPKNVVDDYCNRHDHTDFKDFIESTNDVTKAKALCNRVLESVNEERCRDIKASEFFWLERDASRSVQDTVKLVEKYFGWKKPEDEEVEKDG